ncbi:MAG TPA: BON domain-containing protein [Candidatus Sulfotelmatobacter sp.]
MNKLLALLAVVAALAIVTVLVLAPWKHQDSRQAWLAVLNKCASTQLIGKDVLYFGASNEIGPGSIWRKSTDGSIRLRYELSDLETDSTKRAALIRENNSVACDGSSASTWDVKLGLPFEGTVTPLSADVSTDLKRADSVTVTVNGWAIDELKEGPFESFIRANNALQDEFSSPDRVVVENAVRIAGFSAAFKFSRSISDELRGKFSGAQLALQDGANLQSQWNNDTTLTIKTPDTFYILAAFGRMSGKAGAEAFSVAKTVPPLKSERTVALSDMRIRAVAVQKLQEAAASKPGEEVAVASPLPNSEPVKRNFPNVVVTNGVITLKGSVSNPTTKQDFSHIVEKVPGALGVENKIDLVGKVKANGPEL